MVDRNNIDEEKVASKMERQLSPRNSIIRILIAVIAFVWFLLGGSAQTVLALSGGQLGLVGFVSFLIRNPISFFIIGILNVISGIIFYVFAISLIVMIFHFLWSIRWFYGFIIYRNVKISNFRISKYDK